MHYFQFEIKEWVSNTAHLTHNEESAYLRLICYYYDSERPIPHDDLAMVFRKCRINEDLGKSMMLEFFRMDGNLGAWVHDRCQKEIEKYHAKHEQASKAGKASAQRRLNARSTDVQPIINQESLIINQPIGKAKRGTRLAQDWVLPPLWKEWATRVRPTLNIDETAESFKDFWHSKAGASAVKLDWHATWRNWVRNQNQGRLNPADVAKMTVPSSNERDPTLVKLDEDRKNWTPPPPEIRAKMLEIKASGANANPSKGNL